MPRVLIPLVAGLPAGSVFISANVAALRDPTPHERWSPSREAPPARRRSAPTARDRRP